MATAQKTWDWATGFDNWANSSVSFSATGGSPGGGYLYTAATGRNATVNGTATLTTGTWASLFGISTGATVTDVQVIAGFRYANLGTLVLQDDWSASVSVNDGGYQSLWSLAYSGSTYSSWQTGSAGTKRTLATPQSASSTVDFQIALMASTGNDKNGYASMCIDYLTVEVTYTAPTHELALASEAKSAVVVSGSVYSPPQTRELAFTSESKSAVVIVGRGAEVLDIEVPIEMLVYSYAPAANSTQYDIARSETWLNPADYDGDVTYVFDITTSGVAGMEWALYDATNAQELCVITADSTHVGRNFTRTFTPNSGNSKLVIRAKANASGTTARLWRGGIKVVQTGATKTRIPVGQWMFGPIGTSNSNNDGTLAYCGDMGYAAASDFDPTTGNGGWWKYVANDWATITDVTFEALARPGVSTTYADLYLTALDNTVVGTLNFSAYGDTFGRVTASGLSLTDGTVYKLRGRGDDTFYVSKAYLWLTLNTATKAEVYYPLNAFAPNNGGDGDYYYTRIRVDKTKFSGTAAAYLETSSHYTSTSESVSNGVRVVTYYGDEAATSGAVVGGVNMSGYTSKTWQRSSNLIASMPPYDLYGLAWDWVTNNIDVCGGALVVTAQAVAPSTLAYPTYVGSNDGGADSYSGTAYTTIPNGVKAGDVLLLISSGRTSGTTGTLSTPTDPSSETWNTAYAYAATGTTPYLRTTLFWRRVASASEAGTLVTCDNSGWSTGDGTTLFMAACVAYRGCETSGNPWDDLQYSSADSNATMTVPAVTLSGSNRSLVALVAENNNNQWLTSPSGYTQKYQEKSPASIDGSITVWDLLNVSSDGSVTGTETTGFGWQVFHVALKPPSGATTHELAFTSEAKSAVVVAGTASHVTHELALTSEAKSDVVVTGSVTEGGTTHELALTSEAKSTVAVTGTVTHATLELALTSEAKSAVVAAGSVAHATWELALTSEAKSAVVTSGSVTHATWELTLASESVSAVVVSGSVSHQTLELALASESKSAVVVSGSVSHGTLELALTSEAKSAVVAAGSRAKELALTSESVSAVVASGSVTHATWELALTSEATSAIVVDAFKVGTQEMALTSEAKSAVVVAGSVLHATHELALTSESKSAVVAAGTKTTIRELALTSEAVSAVVTAGSVSHGTMELALTSEAKSSVVVSGSVSHLVHELALTSESKSAVVVAGTASHAVHELALTSEGKSAVVTSGSVSHGTWELALASEAKSAVSIDAQKTGLSELAFTSEALSAVAIAGSVVHVTHELTLTSEAVSAVAVVGEEVGAVHEMALVSEAKSAVAAAGSVSHAVWDLALTSEAKSAVVAAGSALHVTHELAQTSESVSRVSVAGSVGHAVHEISLTSEARSAVVTSASVTHAVWDMSLGSEAVSSVTVAGSVLHVTWELATTTESKSAVTLAGQKNALFERDLEFISEARSRVTATGVRTSPAKLFLTIGAPEGGWRSFKLDAAHGWSVAAPESGWTAKKPT